MTAVILVTGAILLQAALEGLSFDRVVQITAVLSGLVPYGLFLLIVLAYTAGAVRAHRHGALVQLVNAVESGQQRRRRMHRQDRHTDHRPSRRRPACVPVGRHDTETVSAALGAMAHSTGTANLTSARAGRAPSRRTGAGARGGAVQLRPALERRSHTATPPGSSAHPKRSTPPFNARDLATLVAGYTAQGLRVLMFARSRRPPGRVCASRTEPLFSPIWSRWP